MLQGPCQMKSLAATTVAAQTVSLSALVEAGADTQTVHASYPMPDYRPPSARNAVSTLRNAAARPIEVVRLRNVLIADPYGSLRTEEGKWIVDLTPTPTFLFVKDLPRKALAARKPCLRLEGTTALLATKGTGNYYHWLHQILPQIDAIRSAVPPSRIDRWLVHELRPFSREILVRLGIDLAKIEMIGESPVVCDRLVASTLPSMGALDYLGEWPRVLIRELFLPEETIRPWRRIYLRRADRDRRPILNQSQVDELLFTEGFECHSMDGLSIEEQARLMAEAAIVVAPHGAALANLVFCAPGTQVVELLPRLWPSPLYGMIAETCGLRHTFLMGSEPSIPFLRVRQVSAPTEVPVARLAKVLRRLDLGP